MNSAIEYAKQAELALAAYADLSGPVSWHIQALKETSLPDRASGSLARCLAANSADVG